MKRFSADNDTAHRGIEAVRAAGRPDENWVARSPRESDAAAIWHMVQACGELDLNSPYAYLLLCTDFADSGRVIVANHDSGPAVRSCNVSPLPAATSAATSADCSVVHADDQHQPEDTLVGFVLGYRRPSAPDTLFVWQVGVSPEYRGQGLGGRLLDEVVNRALAEHGVEYLEATVTPSNTASRVLFSNFARDRSARIHERVAFWSSSFPATSGESHPAHEDEIRLRIGPLRPYAS